MSFSVSKQSIPTRSSTSVWLVGQQLDNFDVNNCKQLPTVGQVLCRLFYELKTNKLTVPVSCSKVIDEVFQLWQAGSIPTTQKPNAVAKLKTLYQEHVSVSKNKARHTERQAKIESDFFQRLKNLFDVGHADSEKLIKIPQDWKFLCDQRGPRLMVMAGEDKVFNARMERRRKRIHEECCRKERAKQMKESTETLTSVISDDEDDGCTTSTEDEEPVIISKYHQLTMASAVEGTTGPGPSSSNTTTVTTPTPSDKPINKRRVIDDPLLVATLDRTKTTQRMAMHIIAPALKAAGVNIEDLTLSAKSLHTARKNMRQVIGSEIRNTFSPNTPLIAHFDGKLLPDIDNVNFDRLPVVVSGRGIEKLLSIPKLASGTGLVMGTKIVEILNEWDGVPQWLAGLCFDTTSANSGIHTGAITVVQKSFHKRLLFLACRHHMLEIIAAAVFDIFFVSSGPQISLFSRFKEHWPYIDQAKYATIDKDTDGCIWSENERLWLEDSRKGTIDFLQSQVQKEVQPRKDYLELLNLSLITLGKLEHATVQDKVKFRNPGAYHRARWMSKGIYCLKIFCFREQFELTAHELQALKRICLFTVTLYVHAWFSAANSCNAPVNDLHLLQATETFSRVDKKVAEIALRKLRGHMWYISEDLIGLSLFSDLVSTDEKKDIVKALETPENVKDLRRVDSGSVKSFNGKKLSHFATKRSLNLFTALQLKHTFLKSDPETWAEQQDYQKAKEVVSNVRVVNDCAERAVKLATDFNAVLTKDEDQRQLIFQLVEHHRGLVMEPLKKNFTTADK